MTLYDRLMGRCSRLYKILGDPRTKNIAIFILALMSAFGMVAPETATGLRDAVLGL